MSAYNRYLLFLVSLLFTVLLSFGSSAFVRVDDGSYGTTKEQRGNVELTISGAFMGGYIRYPETIRVKYSGLIGNEQVEVQYSIKGEHKKKIENGKNITKVYFRSNRDGIDWVREDTMLEVSGQITKNSTSGSVFLATIRGWLFAPDEGFPSGWLVSTDSKWKASNTNALKNHLGVPLILGDATRGLSMLQDLTLFSVRPDYTLAYDPTPNWMPQRSITKDLIMQAQNLLSKAGFEPGPIDGMLGAKTKTAIRNYQKERGLQVTGRLDQYTLGELGI